MTRLPKALVVSCAFLCMNVFSAGLAQGQATINVTSTADDLISGNSQCTLREAIHNANANADTTSGDCTAGVGTSDTIQVPAGTYALTLTNAGVAHGDNANLYGDLDVTEQVTIDGAGIDATFIQGLNDGSDSGLRDRVIDALSAVEISDLTVENGWSTAANGSTYSGGGIQVVSGVSPVNLTRIRVRNSRASQNGGGIAVGSGSVTVLDASEVLTNISDKTGGGILAGGTFTIQNSSVVSGNRAEGADNSANHGGGIYGGSVLRVYSSTISNNSVTDSYTGGTCKNHGAGIYMANPGGTPPDELTITGSTLDNNDADSVCGDGAGGGIYALTQTLTVSGSTISNNTASRFGGAYLSGTTLLFDDNTVSSNSAVSAVGGVEIAAGGINGASRDLTVSNSTIANNTAGTEHGGVLLEADSWTTSAVATSLTVTGNSAADYGGISMSSGVFTLSESLVENNTVTHNGAGLYLTSGFGSSAGRKTITDTTIRGNVGPNDGGGVYLGAGEATFNRVTISGNEAAIGVGLYATATSDTDINNSTISGNTQKTGDWFGGGIRALSGATIDIFASTITGNVATTGAGIYTQAAGVRLKSTILADNGTLTSPSCSGQFESLDDNLIGDTSGCTITGSATSDILGGTAALGALASNGGSTQTHEPSGSSAALAVGSCLDIAGATSTADQRGYTRAGNCDVGSVQLNGSAPAPANAGTITVTPAQATVAPGASVVISFEGTDVVDLYGVAFRLLYDAALFSFDTGSETAGAFLSAADAPIAFADDQSGQLSLAFTRTNGSTGVTGAGTIGTVSFTALSAVSGTGTFSISSAEFQPIDPAGATLTMLRVDGSVTVAGVWPGDTDNNCTVETADILPIGARFEVTGPARTTGTDYTWASKVFTAWSTVSDSYADATGDGEIDQRDVLPIGLNYAQTRAESTGCTAPASKGMEFSHHLASLPAGQEVELELHLGADMDVLGVALRAEVDPTRFSIQTIKAGPGLDDGDLLEMAILDGGNADVAMTRKGVAASSEGPVVILTLVSLGTGDSEVSISDISVSTPAGLAAAPAGTRLLGADDELPSAFDLAQNYPNPFNPVTVIRYSLPEAASVRLTVFDVLGREVARLIDGQTETSGWHEVSFDASALGAGLYFYTFQASDRQVTRRMVLLK